MKKNKLASILMISLVSMMLIGCNKEETEVTVEVETKEEGIFGLTEDEQKMYAEYAAGVLMKYNAGSNMRVLEGQTLRNLEAKEEAAREQAAKREQAAAEYASSKNDSSKKENQSSGDSSSQGTGVTYINDMSAATGTGAFTITYTGYEVADSYPNSGEDILMAIDATQGKVLLLTKFLVTNISGQTENFDMFSKQPKFKLNIGGTNYKSQYTLLLDDLSMYKGDIDAGAAIDTVLVFEIPESEASNIENMVLSVTTNEGTGAMQLQGGTVIRTETAEPVSQEEENVDESADMEQSEESENDITETEASEDVIAEPEDESENSEGGNVTVVESESN